MKEGTDNNGKVNKHKKNTQNKSSKGIEAWEGELSLPIISDNHYEVFSEAPQLKQTLRNLNNTRKLY